MKTEQLADRLRMRGPVAGAAGEADPSGHRPRLHAQLGREVIRPRTAISMFIPLAVLFFIARGNINLEPSAIWSHLHAADASLLIFALMVYYASFLFRTLRWRTLLASVGYSRRDGYSLPNTGGLCRILFLSYAANCLTVARLGDAYRAYMLKIAADVSFPVTFGTVLTERVLDIVVLMVLVSGAAIIAFHGMLPAGVTGALATGLALSVVGLVAILSMRRLRPVIEWLLPARLHAHYGRLEHGVTGSFQHVRLLVTYSTIAWLLEGCTLFLIAVAVGAPLAFLPALVVALVASLLTAVPFTPAGLGITEAGMVLLLGGLGMDASIATIITLFSRIISFWSIILFGLILYALSCKK